MFSSSGTLEIRWLFIIGCAHLMVIPSTYHRIRLFSVCFSRVKFKHCCVFLSSDYPTVIRLKQYHSEILHLFTPCRDFCSADKRFLKIPRSSSKAFGQRAFSYVDATTWNDLPFYSLRHSDSQTSFGQALKIRVFQQSF